MNKFLCAVLAATSAIGCAHAERRAGCNRLAEAMAVPEPKKRKTADGGLLGAVAKEFDAAARRASSLTELPAELEPIARGASVQLHAAAKELRTAARARKAGRAPEYASAKAREEEARRALADLSNQFSKVCAR